MTRVTTLSQSRAVLADIQRASQKLAETQRKLSSGQDINKPSDDPYKVGRALQLRTAMAQAQNLQDNVDEAQGWADVTDTTLANIGDVIQRARELTIYGATETSAGQPRLQIAAEMRGLIDSVKTAANAQYADRYVLSGTKTDTPPYTLGPDDTFGGNTDLVQREIGPNVTVPVNTTGDDVLGTGPTGLLSQLRGIVTALESDNGAALSNAIAGLDDATNRLLNERAKVGANSARLEAASGRLSQYEGTSLQLLSDVQSTDMAKAMVDFSTQQAALSAGLKAGAQIVQVSLLDFLR